MLGYAGIEGATPSPEGLYNTAYGIKYEATKGAVATTTFDPGHEFEDVLIQLTGNKDQTFTKNSPYPPPTSDPNAFGYAQDYAEKRKLDGGNVRYPVFEDTSPSVDTFDNNAVMALAQDNGGKANLTVLSPQSDNHNNTEASDELIASGTNPSITFLSGDPDSWVAAYSTRNGHKLAVYSLDGKASIEQDYEVASNTSPSIACYDDGKWAAAIQYLNQGSNATFLVVQSDGLTYPTTIVTRKNTNPSICEYSKGKGWIAASVKYEENENECSIFVLKSTNPDSPKLLNSYPMKDTSPAIAYCNNGGHYAVAYQDNNGVLSLYKSAEGKHSTLSGHKMYSGSSPSLYWSEEVGNWIIAYARSSDGTVVVTTDKGATNPFSDRLDVELSGGTSPSIAPLGRGSTSGSDRNLPNYIVGFQDKDHVPAALNAKGLPYITQAPPSDVMQCFDTANQLPVMYDLATQFKVCDNWFSSLPGPTWPNRDFVHCATSGGLDDSPTQPEIASLYKNGDFPKNGDTIYQRLKAQTWPGAPGEQLTYHFYQDCEKAIGDLLKDLLPGWDQRSISNWFKDKLDAGKQ